MRLAIAFVVLAVIAVGVGYAVTKKPPPAPWTKRVSDEILHAPSNHWPRPALSDGGTGHFGDVLDTDWDSLAALLRRWEALGKDVRLDCASATWDGEGGQLHPVCRQWIDEARAKLPLIARAVEGSEAGPPRRFDPLRAPHLSHADDLVIAVRIPAYDAAVRVDAARNETDYDAALDSCVIALAATRDLEWGNGAYGYNWAEASVVLAFLPCALALEHGSASRRARFRDELARIQAGRPTLAHGFVLSRTDRMTSLYGLDVPAEVLERADPEVRARLLATKPFTSKDKRGAWLWLESYEDQLVDAVSLPAEQRRAAFNALKAYDTLDTFYTDDDRDFEDYRSTDAVFEGLSLFARLVDEANAHQRWPDPLPRGEKVRFTPQAHGVTLLLDIPMVPLKHADGGVTMRRNEWFFSSPLSWSR